jgi:hypothetical protein
MITGNRIFVGVIAAAPRDAQRSDVRAAMRFVLVRLELHRRHIKLRLIFRLDFTESFNVIAPAFFVFGETFGKTFAS